MADATIEALKAQLRLLRLPTMGREFDKLAAGRRRRQSDFRSVFTPPDRIGACHPGRQARDHLADQGRADFPVEKDLRAHTTLPCCCQLSKLRRSWN